MKNLEKVKKYGVLNKYVKKGEILFVGSSLMEDFPINEFQQTLAKNYIIYNRGIGGYIIEDLIESMEECVFELEPSKIFINIGTNDISSPEYKKEKLISSYDNVLTQINDRLPNCKVYVMAYYPINAKANFFGVDQASREEMFKTRTNFAIIDANIGVEELAKKHNYEFINVNEGLMDECGNLKEEYSIEGMHMWANGYSVVLENIKKYL
ncbi:MAG: lysophospholipase [Clostridiaceae bacterium]|nr:lysophospholipase [Clostridiaceae bacterium]